MPINLYSKKNQLILRIICISGLVIFLLSNIYEFTKLKTDTQGMDFICPIVGIILNFLSCILFIIVFFFPAKFGVFGFISFYYSIWIKISDTASGTAVFLYLIAVTIILARGLYNHHKKIKFIVTGIVFLSMILFPAFISLETFSNSIIQDLAFTFCTGTILFFYSLYLQNPKTDKVLNLNEFKGLTKRDCDWLNAVLHNEKYESIAINHYMTLGSVKNRFKVIFDTLEVGDKTGFLNRYGDFEINFLQ